MGWLSNLFKSAPPQSPPEPPKPNFKVVEKVVRTEVKRMDISIVFIDGSFVEITKKGTAYISGTYEVSLMTGQTVDRYIRDYFKERGDKFDYIDGIVHECLPSVGEIYYESGWVTYKKNDLNVRVPREQVKSITSTEPYSSGDFVETTIKVLETV